MQVSRHLRKRLDNGSSPAEAFEIGGQAADPYMPPDMGGMTADMMGQMPPEAMGGMTADMMGQMPPEAMGGMNADMMGKCHLMLWVV